MVLLKDASMVNGEWHDVDIDRDGSVDFPGINLEKEMLVASMRGRQSPFIVDATYIANDPAAFLFTLTGSADRYGYKEGRTLMGPLEYHRTYAIDALEYFNSSLKDIGDHDVVTDVIDKLVAAHRDRNLPIIRRRRDLAREILRQLRLERFGLTGYQGDAILAAINISRNSLNARIRMYDKIQSLYVDIRALGTHLYTLDKVLNMDEEAAVERKEDFHEWMFQRAMDYAEREHS